MFQWWPSVRAWSPDAARRQILSGRAWQPMRIAGSLNLANAVAIRSLPGRLVADVIDLSGCQNLHALPAGIRCRTLILRQSGVANLPAGMEVTDRIDAAGCRRLRSVGAYRIRELTLRGCLALESLPNGLQARILDVSRCPLLAGLPVSVLASVEHLDFSDNVNVTKLPANFSRLQTLNVSRCSGLAELAEGIRVRSWIDVADSGLRRLPWSLRSVRVLWHGVEVTDRVAFDPESITADEILGERNQALRSVLLARMGMERFFEEAGAQTVHQDQDRGGTRRLLRIEAGLGEPIVCVDVRCPSTGKQYLLRVPPDMQTCRQAIAWTAGYRNPNRYHPVVET
jgi:hypothetical protein